jgi:hypothetical protein
MSYAAVTEWQRQAVEELAYSKSRVGSIPLHACWKYESQQMPGLRTSLPME